MLGVAGLAFLVGCWLWLSALLGWLVQFLAFWVRNKAFLRDCALVAGLLELWVS